MVCLDFPTTNNEAEHKALVAGLDLAKAARATSVIIHCDSQVVTSQVNGNYECRGERMKKYLEQVWKRVSGLQAKFVQILREENEQADCLAKAALAEHMFISSKVLSFVHLSPLIDDVGVQEIDLGSNWTTPMVSYLKNETEVHEGICGNHSGLRSLVHKLIRARYYWPTMQKDAQTYVKAYNKCQRFNNVIKQLTEELTPMTAPWPFTQ